MYLANLKTHEEKEAFLNLAFMIANADGSLDFDERVLINLFQDEMNLEHGSCAFQRQPMSQLCRTFSDPQSRRLAFGNLMTLAYVDDYDSEGKKSLLDLIQQELSILPGEAKKLESELKVLKGSYLPCYGD